MTGQASDVVSAADFDVFVKRFARPNFDHLLESVCAQLYSKFYLVSDAKFRIICPL